MTCGAEMGLLNYLVIFAVADGKLLLKRVCLCIIGKRQSFENSKHQAVFAGKTPS
jgi:hypothetical protein